MKGLTLKHFRYFAALAQHRHFGRAAEACAISQPALSLQIKELEEMLGAPLVERDRRQVRLTGLGDVLAERAGEILRAVEEVGDLARGSRDDLSGPFRLGIIPTIAPYLLPDILKRLTERFPRLDIHVRETVTPRLADEIRSGRLDAAILALPLSEPSFVEVELLSESFMFVRPLEDADKPVPDGQALQKMKLLLLEEGHCFRDQALSFCNIDAPQTRDLMDGSSLSTLVQMVGAGIGVTLIPEMAIRVETRSAPVSVARFRDPEPMRTIGMTWRKTNPLEQQLRTVSEIVREAALDLRGQQATPP
ncbi:hydrogen peroxide-inducible genes activator [Pontivivens ytuae]|uniref:Hydrogen peroxide-inducible genes activator n=1 Tax=Pontivivens ytuae TaxID=2789856 RepID=A0A7S9LUM8_9RHOB|nr:hydrogen peroxide-inducible genes activator [Pontivivens ytuae]QPH55559.1 hydrogen peroxide-inducible genes activator [Pontivivens ytuae]